jgi:hypothetical protein
MQCHFCQNTYLTIVAKTMAALVLGVEVGDPWSLLSREPFQYAEIYGVVESDFFDRIVLANGGGECG